MWCCAALSATPHAQVMPLVTTAGPSDFAGLKWGVKAAPASFSPSRRPCFASGNNLKNEITRPRRQPRLPRCVGKAEGGPAS
ncbi:hypothetical protein A0U91_10290 [Acetobacter persici]|uniref:Uncharacterized protein n=1 Tax=Acetobacter persici TaxID=1076596 RepID=A0A1U9LFG1_9PROT|nr:hypothetical protein A0U91_10290 [Acetobacter persici]